jgi:asparagine synthase (glutamine-hydrolysing)
MCGIAGLVYEGGKDQAAASAVRRMIALQRHRGPDGEGFYDTPGASLGHCRLAIIDLTDTGRQPMSDAEGRFWITFNGEIYNYRELAQELLSNGHRFKGSSDTEVLLAAFREWGNKCLDRLRGMFAFAIWDTKTQTLFAARDRLGIKPFHYWINGGRQLAFASEIKALLDFVPQRAPNHRLASEFLAWNLLDHDPVETMFADINRLPAAHALLWRAGEPLRVWRYWEVAVGGEFEVSSARERALISEFRQRFEECISLHLRSDVPVGTCLSGGLDSSAIACITHAELHRRGEWRVGGQHTFSACFQEPELDETPYIQSVVSAIHCQPHYVFPSGEGLLEDFDKWLWHQEEPVGGTGVYAQYCVARLAKQAGIKVLLDGQGSDEQLAGYRKFILVYLRELLKAGRYITFTRELAEFFCHLEVLRTCSFVDGRRYLFDSLPEVSTLWPDRTVPERPESLGIGWSVGRRIEADMTQFSLPPLLRFEDRNMMAFGVESRVPFVDHILVEWMAKLPVTLRLSGGWSKRILREALRGILPEQIRTRRSKLGFSTPESTWLAGPLSTWLRVTLSAPAHLAEVVNLRGVKDILGRYDAGDRSGAVENTLFRLAIYESWARRFLGSPQTLK